MNPVEPKCESCGGTGRKAYGCTSVWMGGAGGQMVTEGICDRCWGTGDASKPGPNLRIRRQEAAK